MPELSICIPTYNSAHFLPDTIGSIMRQHVSDFEIVIVDNASEDDTERYVRGLKNEHIRYFRNAENLGPHHSSRRSLLEARGTYIKYLCADDVLLDGVLLKQLAVLRERPEVSLVSCDMYVTDSELKVQRVHRFYPGVCKGARLKNVCLTGLGNYIGGPTNFMFRRAALEGINFDTKYHAIGDLKFALQLLEHGDYANIDLPGHLYRRHSQSDSVVGVTADNHRFEFMRMVDEYDWWNPVNCLLTIRRGGPQWKKAVTRRWAHAIVPGHLVRGFTSAWEVLRIYMRDRRDFRDGAPLAFTSDHRHTV